MPLKVIFICIGNRARSQLAEGLLRRLAPAGVESYSAGLEPRLLGPEGVHPLVHETLAELGVDSSAQYSKTLEQALPLGPFDYVISVCAEGEEKCPVLPGMGVRLRWAMPDPVIYPLEDYPRVFRELRDALRDRIAGFVAEL